ncbi:MAG: hypothetical protein ACYDEE_15635 [Ignavibacteriaceae bacterium]
MTATCGCVGFLPANPANPANGASGAGPPVVEMTVFVLGKSTSGAAY